MLNSIKRVILFDKLGRFNSLFISFISIFIYFICVQGIFLTNTQKGNNFSPELRVKSDYDDLALFFNQETHLRNNCDEILCPRKYFKRFHYMIIWKFFRKKLQTMAWLTSCFLTSIYYDYFQFACG